MTPGALAAVGVGAVLGAWLRWGLGAWLNPLLPSLPMGTHLVGAIFATFLGFATYRALA